MDKVKIARELLKLARQLTADYGNRAHLLPRTGEIFFFTEDTGSPIVDEEEELLDSVKSLRLRGFKIRPPKRKRVNGKPSIVVHAEGRIPFNEDDIAPLLHGFVVTTGFRRSF